MVEHEYDCEDVGADERGAGVWGGPDLDCERGGNQADGVSDFVFYEAGVGREEAGTGGAGGVSGEVGAGAIWKGRCAGGGGIDDAVWDVCEQAEAGNDRCEYVQPGELR